MSYQNVQVHVVFATCHALSLLFAGSSDENYVRHFAVDVLSQGCRYAFTFHTREGGGLGIDNLYLTGLKHTPNRHVLSTELFPGNLQRQT